METKKLESLVVREFISEDMLNKKKQYKMLNDENYDIEKCINEIFHSIAKAMYNKLSKQIEDGTYWNVKSERSKIEIYIYIGEDYEDAEHSELHSRKLSEVFTESELNELTEK